MKSKSNTSGAKKKQAQGQPAQISRYTQPVVLKQGGLFLLCAEDGSIKRDSEQGLYFHDMRYLSSLEMLLGDRPLVPLLADASEGDKGTFELTNPDVKQTNGESLGKESLGVSRRKTLADNYEELIEVENYSQKTASFAVQFTVEADFADMFAVRGAQPQKRGELQTPTWNEQDLILAYHGADEHQRALRLKLSQTPDVSSNDAFAFQVSLEPQQKWSLRMICEIRDEREGPLERRPMASEGPTTTDKERAKKGTLGPDTQIETDSTLFDAVLARSLMDLHMLRMRQKGDEFFAAGVPWYVALFGRDSLITAIQTVALDAGMAEKTLRLLAAHQGKQVDDWRDEQPGKILHEYRVDEMANLNEVPQTPYYGSVDSTPLFLILLGLHAQWSGSLRIFHELSDNVQDALAWIDNYGDSDGDGFIDYKTRSSSGSRNQGWKDSGNGVVMEDGRLAEPPIAMPEVQGDVYLAWSLIASLFERDGKKEVARGLRDQARSLYERFNDQFWLDDIGYYALCKQNDGKFSRSVASNAAQTLWTGIIEPARAKAVAERALRDDLWTGWGVRTLASTDRSYNPVDYQVGSVWPHDNAFIVAGLHQYGLTVEAGRIFAGLVSAAVQFEHFRLPETFAGYSRDLASRPVKYPVACNPQAWAAGSIPFMLMSCLGLEPDGFHDRLFVHNPSLPPWVHHLELRDLHVGRGRVDLHFEAGQKATLVKVVKQRGDDEVDVVVDQAPSRSRATND